MSHSIEEIWKKGFISNEALVAPKINDLYNQKSKNIIDRFELMFKWNLIGIGIFAVLTIVVMSFTGIPYLGMFIAAMFMSLVIRGRKEQASLKLLNKEVSSYQYLKSFHQWITDLMAGYAKLYSFFYPVLFLAIALQLRFSDIGQEAINGFVSEFPMTTMYFSTPLFVLVIVSVIAVLLHYFAAPLYRADFNSLYGRMFKKLEELIKDMEELRR